MTIYRAVDVGYGNTKFVRDFRPLTNAITADLFPSLAPKAQSGGLAGDGQFLDKRKTRLVKVDGVSYEVGQDAVQARAGNESGRTLTTDYCLSSTYLALCRGAMAEMNVPELGALVLGLPMSTWQKHKSALADRMTGRHEIADGLTIDVCKTIVVPQPLGGFYDFAFTTNQFVRMKGEVNLIIDPGYYTLDWLVTEGTKPVEARSGAVNDGGVSAALAAVIDQIEADEKLPKGEVGGNAGMVDRVDAALRGKDTLRIFGKRLNDVDRYLKVARDRCTDPMNALVKSVGNPANIDNIIVVGGGAHIYAPIVKEKFPRHEIQIANEAVFGNVRGFQIIGAIWAKNIK
jgi:plasmid segregation protein ParM